jgi:hypothetical protein
MLVPQIPDNRYKIKLMSYHPARNVYRGLYFDLETIFGHPTLEKKYFFLSFSCDIYSKRNLPLFTFPFLFYFIYFPPFFLDFLEKF